MLVPKTFMGSGIGHGLLLGAATAKTIAKLIIVAAMLAATTTANATIAVQNYYRLGEIDTPSMPPLTRDYVGGIDLTLTNSTGYSGDASPGTGSSLSMSFVSPADYATSGVLSTVTNNFGIAAWVKTSDLSAGLHILVFNGDTGNNGFGIYRDGSNWIGLLGGSALVGGAPVQSGVWTHLALVRDNGMTTFYANGVATGLPVPNNVNPPVGGFSIATEPTAPGSLTLVALVDEVQFFTFLPGLFRVEGMFPAQAQYDCNGTFNDSTLFGRDLSAANLPVPAAFGSPGFTANARSGRACTFNSAQALGSVMNDFPFTNEATYSFWINMAGGLSHQIIMQATDGPSPLNTIDVCGVVDPSCADLGLRVFGDDSGFPGSRRFIASPSVNDNSWHHMAITTAGTLDSAQVYIDGAGPLPFNAAGNLPMSSMNLRGTFYVGTAQGLIGSSPSNFVGSLDDIRIDARVLSAAEIGALAAPPGMGAIADGSTNEDAATAALPFTVLDLQTPGALTLSFLSSTNPGLVGAANVAFGGTGANRNLTVTPAADQSGTATVTVQVSDGLLTDAQSFTVTVNPVNDPPSFVQGPNRSHPAGTNTAQTATSWATGISDGDPDFVQILNFNVINNNPGLFSTSPAIAANGTLTYTPSGMAGSATVTVSLSDDGNAGGPALTTPNQVFNITVLPLDVISNLEAQYRCNGDSLDSTSAVRHLAPQYGAVSYATNARSGRACEFDGATRLGSAISAFAQSTDVTYSAWLRKPGVAPAQQVFMQTVSGASTSPTQNSIDLDSTPRLRFWGTNLMSPFSFNFIAAGGLYDGNWHHVAITASGTNASAQIYFDGVAASTGINGLDSIVDLATTLYLGARSDSNSGATQNFVGSLDDVSVYSRVLGPADIAELAAPPGMGAIADSATNEDVATAPLPFNIVDLQTPAAALVVSVLSSSNPGLLPVANVSLGGTGTNRTLTATPAPNQSGSSTITLQVSDGALIDTQSFVLTVNAVNDPPSFVAGSDQIVIEDSGAQTVPGWANAISTGAADESAQSVTFIIAANSNPGLFSVPPTVSSAGVLSYTPAANANGVANIDLRLMDNGGVVNGGVDISAIQSFSITVNAVNDPPSFNGSAIAAVAEDAGAQSIPSWAGAISAGPPDEAGQTISFAVTAVSNPALFSSLPMVSPAGVLSFTPAADASGSSTFDVQAIDNGGTANGGLNMSNITQFAINVLPVNDPPSFNGSAIAAVSEDAGTQSIPGWAGAISAGPPDEAGQTISFAVTAVSNPALFSSLPMVSPAGTLTFTAALNANGSATFDVQAIDSGGTANGGVNMSNIAQFNIIVNPVNDLPSFSKGADQTLMANAPAQSIANWATAINDGDPEVVQALTFNLSNNNAALFSAQPSVAADGRLQFTPSGVAGIATVSVSLSDDASAGGGPLTSAIQSFTVTLRATPTLAIVDQVPVATVVGELFSARIRVVNPTGSLQPTGTINATVAPIGNQVSCTLAPVATPPGASEALCTGLVALRAVDMVVIASYAGDAVFLTRSGNQVHSVSKANTRLTILADTPDPSQSNAPVNVSYQLEVLPPSQSPLAQLGGQITLSDGPNQVSIPFAAGTQMVSIVLTGEGTRPLTLRYDSDKNFNDSTDAETHTVIGGGNTDLSVVISNRREYVPTAGSTTYYVDVGNLGSVASSAQLDALIPSGLSSYNWTCSASAGSSCQSAAGNGSVVAGVNVAPGGLVRYQIQANVTAAEGSVINNQAIITPAIDPPDSNASNNASTDRDVVAPFASGFEN